MPYAILLLFLLLTAPTSANPTALSFATASYQVDTTLIQSTQKSPKPIKHPTKSFWKRYRTFLFIFIGVALVLFVVYLLVLASVLFTWN